MVFVKASATWRTAVGHSTTRLPIIGCSSRPSSPTVAPSAVPLEHRRPALAGWAGSPATIMARPPADRALTPQPTPQ